MTKLMAIVFLWTFFVETSAQEQAEEGAISYFTYFGENPDEGSPHQAHTLSTAVASSADTASALNIIPAGVIIPVSYPVTEDELPFAVAETLKKRYYSRGFTARDLRLIRLTDNEKCYSANLMNKGIALLVMLDEHGRVFKAELQ